MPYLTDEQIEARERHVTYGRDRYVPSDPVVLAKLRSGERLFCSRKEAYEAEHGTMFERIDGTFGRWL